jgi:hypothetical protein
MGKTERIGRRRRADLEAPASLASPQIELLRRCAFTVVLQAASGVEAASAPKYTSSGVQYSRHW